MRWTSPGVKTQGDERGPPRRRARLLYSTTECISARVQAIFTRVCPQVCVCFHVWRTPLTDEKEKAPRPTGDQFPQSVLRACSLLRAGGNNTPQPANFICCHILLFSVSLSLLLKHNTVPPRLPTVHHCTACEAEIGCSGLSKVSKLSPPPRMFSFAPLYFSICHVLRVKIHQTSWF